MTENIKFTIGCTLLLAAPIAIAYGLLLALS